jgi:hypothetical protein
MTKSNIVQRQEWVNKFLHSYSHLKRWRSDTAYLFSCSNSTVLSDIYLLKVKEKFGDISLYPNFFQKAHIKKRDKSTCQYCGKVNPLHGETEHVICCMRGGVTETYNMVYACKSCNKEKRDSIWIPRNIKELALEDEKWSKKIERLHSKDKRIRY